VSISEINLLSQRSVFFSDGNVPDIESGIPAYLSPVEGQIRNEGRGGERKRRK
jgi:hypothetical protein